jgi:hypothetical protein
MGPVPVYVLWLQRPDFVQKIAALIHEENDDFKNKISEQFLNERYVVSGLEMNRSDARARPAEVMLED